MVLISKNLYDKQWRWKELLNYQGVEIGRFPFPQIDSVLKDELEELLIICKYNLFI